MPESLPVRDPAPPTRAPWMENARTQELLGIFDARSHGWTVYDTSIHGLEYRLDSSEWLGALCTAVERATLAAEGPELAALREDARRMDWLEAGNDVLVVGERMTVRESIDAAMQRPPMRLGAQLITAARAVPPTTPETPTDAR